MERLSDDLVLQMSRFLPDPADLARLAMTCRRTYHLCRPLPCILSNATYALTQQPIFLECPEEDHAILSARQYNAAVARTLTTVVAGQQQPQQQQQWGPLYMFVYHAPSGQRAYLGRFQRTRVFVQSSSSSSSMQEEHGTTTHHHPSEVHYGLAFKTGKPEEHWTIHNVVAGSRHDDTNTLTILGTLHCYGTEKDCRGWTKARDLTANVYPKGVQMDAFGKCFTTRSSSKEQQEEEQKGSLFRLAPVWALTEKPPMEALAIPVLPKPLFSFAGKITVFAPSPFSAYDFWKDVPAPSHTQIAMEFDDTLHQGIYTVRARGMPFGVSLPVLVEDGLGNNNNSTADDYRYFLLHLFRRNSGRWETLLTYFAHTARVLLQSPAAGGDPQHPPLASVPPMLQAAVQGWPAEHRDHSYQIRDNNLYIHVRDGVIDTDTPTIFSSPDPWRLFLCDV